jgi:uncharacterized membrane protein
VAPAIYLNFVFNSLPDSVALHFGADGQPDRFGNKSELWAALLIMMVVSLFVYLVMTNIGKIDPKKQTLQSKSLMQRLGMTTVAFISLINIYIIYSSYNSTNGKFVFVMIGVFFALIGNYLNNIKPNHFVGLRLPWTLENEDNWRKTHQFGSKIWVGGGLLIAFMAIFLSPKIMVNSMLTILVIMVLIPSIFSYQYNKGSKNNLQ